MKPWSEKEYKSLKIEKKCVKKAGQNKKDTGVGEKMLKKTHPTQNLYL